METSSTQDSNSSTNSNTSIVLPDSSNSYDKDDQEYKDIIMLHVRTSVSYTSLKDLLHESQTCILSPTTTNTSNSCYEIPIKNHLVKQAALAYLSPMSSPQPAGGSRWFGRLKDVFCCCCCCCCGCGCLEWLNVVLFGIDDDGRGRKAWLESRKKVE